MYPKSVCICEGVETAASHIHVLVLQHPNEAKHKKNSARLLPLCMSESVTMCIGSKSEDFSDAQQFVANRNPAIFYPSIVSKGLEAHFNDYQAHQFDTIIILDANWRQAYAMYQMNPWLHSLPSWHFDKPPSNQYKIRKAKIENSLSTIEATAYALQKGHGINTTPLLNTFKHMQNTVFAKHSNLKKT